MDLSIILLSYNTRDITLKTLASLGRAIGADKPLKIEVIVVDNASTDGSGEAIRQLQAEPIASYQLQAIYNKENVGFSKGNNIGLKQATGKYVLFLNSDMIVDDLRLSELITYLDAHPKVGVLTPRVELSSGQIDPASHRGFPTVWRSFCYYSGIEKLASSCKLPGSLMNYLGGYHLKGEKAGLKPEVIEHVKGSAREVNDFIDRHKKSANTFIEHRNQLWLGEEEYWKVDYHQAYMVRRGNEFVMIGGYVLLEYKKVERNEYTGNLELWGDGRKDIKPELRTKVIAIGTPLKGRPVLSCKAGDTVIVDQRTVQEYNFWGNDYLLARQDQILAKV
jgi:glycosyltransferase involved in cell wall biosynthesis